MPDQSLCGQPQTHMKYFILLTILGLFLYSCASTKALPVATSYEVIKDEETKVLKGTLSRSLIENDTAFAWFKNNMMYGSVDEFALNAFTQKAGRFSILVFCGTWCHDSQNLLPKFYSLLDKSHFPDNQVTLIGVDRAKTAFGELHTKWNINSVPTFIILVKGKEVGRVVEYGKTGNIEKELGEVVLAIK